VRREGFTWAIGACSNEGGSWGAGENVGYLTEVSVRKLSISTGEDLIFSAVMGRNGYQELQSLI
jgi:hypothetical protein